MPRVSAGLLMYRIQDGKLQVLLAHPGGSARRSGMVCDGTVRAFAATAGQGSLFASS